MTFRMRKNTINEHMNAKRISKFSNLDLNHRCLWILIFLALAVFLALTPLFFFHNDTTNYPYGAYALGWLLGSAVEIVSYWTIVKMSEALQTNTANTAIKSIGFLTLRAILYVAVLLVSAICTFKSGWFGGFNAFNFFTTAAGLLPMGAVLLLAHFFELKKVDAVPETKDAIEEKPDEKSASSGEGEEK